MLAIALAAKSGCHFNENIVTVVADYYFLARVRYALLERQYYYEFQLAGKVNVMGRKGKCDEFYNNWNS